MFHYFYHVKTHNTILQNDIDMLLLKSTKGGILCYYVLIQFKFWKRENNTQVATT